MPGLLHRILHNIFSRWIYIRFLRKPVPGPEAGRPALLIVTVAYGRADFIEKQIRLLQKFIKDPEYEHIVVDNSATGKSRREMRTLCQELGATYVPVPRFPEKFICDICSFCSFSHAVALNWFYYSYLRKRRPVLFALLDHDIFPFSDFSLTERLGASDFYGVRRVRLGGSWYWWPGWSIYRFDAMDPFSPDFSPVFRNRFWLDTGGGNYSRIYRNLDSAALRFATEKTLRVRQCDRGEDPEDIYYGDCIQIIDGKWVHLINGSVYRKLSGKEDLIQSVLERLPSPSPTEPPPLDHSA